MSIPNGLKLRCSIVEDIWCEIVKNRSKYIVGEIYRHPKHYVCDFCFTLYNVLSKLSDIPHTVAKQHRQTTENTDMHTVLMKPLLS